MQSQEFEHFVITRFTAVFGADHDPMEEDWLYYRLGFFYDALYPSMAAQQGAKPFTWLVWFDDRCSEGFREQIEEMAEGVFTPVWTHEVFQFSLPQEIERRGTGAPWLLTTRIDSDDAVAKDYMAAIQAQFEPTDGLSINFPRGVQVDREGSVYLYDEPTGAFQSYISQRKEGAAPRTVFTNPQHSMARSIGPLREVKAPPMWMQIIHGTNIANGVRGLRISPKVVNERFEISLQYRREADRSTLLREWARSAARRTSFWVKEPYFAAQWVDAKLDRLRGTHAKAHNPEVTGPPVVSSLRPGFIRLRSAAMRVSLVRSETSEQRALRRLVERGVVRGPEEQA